MLKLRQYRVSFISDGFSWSDQGLFRDCLIWMLWREKREGGMRTILKLTAGKSKNSQQWREKGRRWMKKKGEVRSQYPPNGIRDRSGIHLRDDKSDTQQKSTSEERRKEEWQINVASRILCWLNGLPAVELILCFFSSLFLFLTLAHFSSEVLDFIDTGGFGLLWKNLQN